MPLVIRRINRPYTVGRGAVELRIVVGDGQLGSTVAKLDGVETASGILAMLRIGDGPDLKGSKLRVGTTVTDVQRGNNHTSVTYELSGGQPSPAPFPMDADADHSGGSVMYIATFTFE